MVSILIVLSQFCAVTNMATASRQLFSFARDRGVPFHAFFQKARLTLRLLNMSLSLKSFFLGPPRMGHSP